MREAGEISGSAQLRAANLAAALEAADQARIAALDALLIHRTKQAHARGPVQDPKAC